jgi:hypothetical protein
MAFTTLLNQATAMQTANGSVNIASWSGCETLAIDVNCTDRQGSSPTLQIAVDRLGADGVTYFNIWLSSATSVSGANMTPVQISKSIGPGCAQDEEIGGAGRVRWAIGGSSTPGANFSISLQGK